MYNKQKIIDNLINLLNDVTTKRDEAKFSCKSFQIKTTSQKANNINETISSNRFSIAQNKNQVNVAKEQVAAAPSNTSTKQNIQIIKIATLLRSAVPRPEVEGVGGM